MIPENYRLIGLEDSLTGTAATYFLVEFLSMIHQQQEPDTFMRARPAGREQESSGTSEVEIKDEE